MKTLLMTMGFLVSLNSMANISKLSNCIDNVNRMYDMNKKDRLIKKCISKYHASVSLDDLFEQILRAYSIDKQDKLLLTYINKYFNEMDMEQCFNFSTKLSDIDSQDMMHEKCIIEKEPLD